MPSLLSRKKMGIYRLIYLIIYFVLIVYPLYRIYEYAFYLDQLFQTIVLGGLVLVFFAILYGAPDLIVIYYIIAGLVYRVNYVPGAPGLHEVIVYSIFILHADIVSKLVTLGFGYRKIRASTKGIPFSVLIPAIMIVSYIMVAYYVANMFLLLTDNVIYSSELSRVVFSTFLSTRIGSLILFLLVIFGVFFVLSNFVTDVASDTIWLNPSYAKTKIVSWLRKEYRELVENRSWHQKIYTSAITTTFLFITMSLVYPILFRFIEITASIIGGHVSESEVRFVSLILVLPLSYFIGRSFKNFAFGFIGIRRQRELYERELKRSIVVHKSDPFLYMLITIGYLIFLSIIDPDLPYHVINRVFGVEATDTTMEHPLFRWVVEILDDARDFLNENFIKYLNNYILQAISEYRRLIELIKMAIKLLW